MNWTRGRVIGHGSSAEVSIATALWSSQVFAVKSVELSKSKFLQKEQKILSLVNCPQVIGYKGCDFSEENDKIMYNLFMEYAPGGTVIDAIRAAGEHPREATIRSYALEIVRGLEYLHAHGIVHCDIKGRNILVTSDGAKIGDFGCARLVNDDMEGPDSLRIAGTPMFMAPEVARGEEQGYPADIWAVGCTIIEMATGQAPWANVFDPVCTIYRIGYSKELPEIPSWLSDEAKDFVGKCLRRNPAERWSAKELLKHSFLKGNGFVAMENHGLYSDSPTCVLDQGVWDSTEELECEITQNSNSRISSKSVADRIRELIGGSLMKSPDWDWDKSWVTVRGNDYKEEMVISNIEESSETNYVESSIFDFYFLDQSFVNSRKCGCSKSSETRKSELMMICELCLFGNEKENILFFSFFAFNPTCVHNCNNLLPNFVRLHVFVYMPTTGHHQQNTLVR